MSDCPYPQHFQRDDRGRCTSVICPAREDCGGEEPEVMLVDGRDDVEKRLAALEAEVRWFSATARDWAEFKRVLSLFIGRTEGGDRGPE